MLTQINSLNLLNQLLTSNFNQIVQLHKSLKMRHLVFLFLILMLASCANNTENNTEDELEDKEYGFATAESSSAVAENYYPEMPPSEMVAGIPVYNSFDEIEHILHKDNDTTYLINFWATWCKPCVEEMPYIEKINQEYADKKVKVVLVSLDFKRLAEKKLIPFIAENNIQSEVRLLADGFTSKWIDRVSSFWDGAIPYSVVYNQQDRAEMAVAHSYDEINNLVASVYEKGQSGNTPTTNNITRRRVIPEAAQGNEDFESMGDK